MTDQPTDRTRHIESGLLARRSPSAIVADARDLMRIHLNAQLSLSMIAKSLVMSRADLQACFREVKGITLEEDLYMMRLHALFEAIKDDPRLGLKCLIKQVGLRPSQKLDADFTDAFWISMEDHYNQSLYNQGRPPVLR